jgi:hypothetical protein
VTRSPSRCQLHHARLRGREDARRSCAHPAGEFAQAVATIKASFAGELRLCRGTRALPPQVAAYKGHLVGSIRLTLPAISSLLPPVYAASTTCGALVASALHVWRCSATRQVVFPRIGSVRPPRSDNIRIDDRRKAALLYSKQGQHLASSSGPKTAPEARNQKMLRGRPAPVVVQAT